MRSMWTELEENDCQITPVLLSRECSELVAAAASGKEVTSGGLATLHIGF